MNHIYKVVFNKAIGTFVAVAEYAKGQGKSSNKSAQSMTTMRVAKHKFLKINALMLAIVGSIGLSTQVYAASNVFGSATGTNSVAVGQGSTASGLNSVALGNNSSASGTKSIAIGDGARSHPNPMQGVATIAIGVNAYAKDRNAIAIGLGTQSGNAGVSIGAGARASTGGSALGQRANAEIRGVSIGQVSKSNKDGVAVGYGSKAVKSGGVAIGRDARANQEDSVALGRESVANREAITANAGTSSTASASGNTVYASDTATNADKNAISATVKGENGAVSVSVGNATNTRQITNVAAGSEDSDAVNVAQLKAVANGASSPLTFTGNTNADTDTDGTYIDADGNEVSYIAGDGTQRNLGDKIDIIGSTSAVDGVANDATGEATTGAYSAKNIQTVVTDGQVQLQMADNPQFTSVNATSSVTIGDTDGENTVLTTTTDGLNVGGDKITNVAAGDISSTSTEVVNGSQLHATNQQVTINTTNIATNTTNIASNSNDIAINATNISNNSNAISTNATNITNNTTAINKGLNVGDGTTANNYQLGDTVNITGDSNITTETTANGVEIGLSEDIDVNSVTAGNTSISQNGVNAGGNTITNVAPGVYGTDAVNINQLNELGYKVTVRMDDMEEQYSAGIASSAAIENAPYIPGKWTYAAGASHYNEESAIGVSLRRTADNGRWSINGGVSTNTQNDPLFKIGVSGVID